MRNLFQDCSLAQYDTDGDGKLSEDERKAARESGANLPNRHGHKKCHKKGGKRGGPSDDVAE